MSQPMWKHNGLLPSNWFEENIDGEVPEREHRTEEKTLEEGLNLNW